jgi:hypothetical protein
MARAYIDAYCERTGPEIWNEPLNAVTNLAFIVSAVLLVRTLRRSPEPVRGDWGPWTLAALVFLVGIGSGLFHTLAVGWAAAADVIPIALFVLFAVYLSLRRLAGWGIWPSLIGVAVVLPAGIGLRVLIPFGGAAYLAPLLAMLVIGLYLRVRLRQPGAPTLLAAAGTFAVSLTFRTLDLPLCEMIPTGTHFLWHILNAVVLYLAALAIIRHGRAAS